MVSSYTTGENLKQDYFCSVQPKSFPSLPAHWISETETFLSADSKFRLFGVLHRNSKTTVKSFFHIPHGLPEKPDRIHEKKSDFIRVLIICHGIGEHGGRYYHFPHFVQDSVDAVYCYDHRGHGRSGGLKGHIESFQEFSGDLIHAVLNLHKELAQRYQHIEIHLLGHSMGSLIMFQALLAREDLPIKTSIASSPLLGIRVKIPLLKKWAAFGLSRIWGSLQMTSEIDAKSLSRDPNVAEAYIADRLVHSKVTPKLFTEMLNTFETMNNNIQSQGLIFHYPLLALIPEADHITDSEKANVFIRGLQQKDKCLKSLPEYFHESFNDLGKEKVFEEINRWIQQHSNRNYFSSLNN